MNEHHKSSGRQVLRLTTGGDRVPHGVAPVESLFDRMTRDLHAWRIAKGVIEQAKRPK